MNKRKLKKNKNKEMSFIYLLNKQLGYYKRKTKKKNQAWGHNKCPVRMAIKGTKTWNRMNKNTTMKRTLEGKLGGK